jgi:hypothetical protein
MRKIYILVFLLTSLFNFLQAQCHFTISPIPTSDGCYEAVEDVVLRALNNTSTTANNVVKIASSNNWNGGFYSTASVNDYGYMQTVVNETNTNRMVGLSPNNPNSNWNSIDYAFYLRSNGQLEIRENGSGNRIAGGQSYATADTLKITVEAGVVKYYQNGNLLYISNNAPTLPLFVDGSIYTLNGTLEQLQIINLSDGNFSASSFNGGAGTTPTYQWYLNGTPLGTNSPNYSNTTLSDGDQIRVELTPGTAGCAAGLQTSNNISIRFRDRFDFGEFYIVGDATSSACQFAEEEVVWRIASLQNLEANASNLLKIQQDNNWNGAAFSHNAVQNNGYMELTVSQNNLARMIGLSPNNPNANWNSIDYAFYLRANGNLEIRENGSGNRLTTAIPYNVGDVLRIAVEANDVKYYQNGNLIYFSNIAPTLPLYADVSIYDQGGQIGDLVIANYNDGNYTAIATNAGANPIYQWQLNGVNVGANSPNYTNASLAPTDVLTCLLTPDANGCTAQEYRSNEIRQQVVTNPIAIDFSIQGVSTTSACNKLEEEVGWRVNSILNLDVNGSNLEKIQQDGNWDGAAFSWNTVDNNGHMEFVVTETNRNRMIGLSPNNPNANWNSIDYAFFLRNNGNLEIRENGSGNRLAAAIPYNTGDVLRISVEANDVKYYQNGNLLYISGIAPTLPLFVDVSIEQVGGTLGNVTVSNYNTGDFIANVSNAGTNPSFQWMLNGVAVGTNSPNYNNPNLADGDQLSCILTPDLPACNTVNYNSNLITNRLLTDPVAIDFYIEGLSSAVACNRIQEEVQWQINSVLNLEAIDNNVEKIQQDANWNGAAASLNTVKNNGYMEFVASETNRNRMIGLSANNPNANWNSIDYAFFLRNNGILEIRENGSGNRLAAAVTYNTSDILRISVEANDVKYYQNGNLLYVSNIGPTLPLLVDLSIEQVGGTLNDIIISNYNTGDFVATATNAGSNPTYQWQLNGVNVGTNSPNYTNTNLAPNDELICILTPDLPACVNALYSSNLLTNELVGVPTGIDFYIEVDNAPNACRMAVEEVVWRVNSLRNLEATGNSLEKIQEDGNWNGAAFSWNQVREGGYFEFDAIETNRNRMIGLSANNPNANWNSIDYTFFLRNNGTFEIRENGSGNRMGSALPYNSGDQFRIEVEGGRVLYFHNGALVYSSNVNPTLPLYVDLSIEAVGGTVSAAMVANLAEGNFTATTVNAGANPSFQWQVNGVNVGTNSPTYSNPALNDQDLVTCLMSPDIPGCTNVSFSSNTIEFKAAGVVNQWLGLTTDWNTPFNWTEGVPDRLSIVQIPLTANNPIINADAEVNSITIDPSAQLTINNNNTLSIYQNFNNNGGFVANNSTVEFVACEGDAFLNGTNITTFHNLRIDMAFDLIVQSGIHQVANNFDLVDGIVFQQATLQFLDGSGSTNSSLFSYIDGRVEKIGSNDFMFPLGDDNRYAPIEVSNLSALTTFSAEYHAQPYVDVTTMATTPTPALNNVSRFEYWDLDQPLGTATAQVRLYWEDADWSDINDCASGDLKVAHWNGTAWENPNNAVAYTGTCVGNSAGTVQTVNPVTSFSPFTFGSLRVWSNQLPVELVDFEAELLENQKVELLWQTASEENAAYFEVERSDDLQNWSVIGEKMAAGTSTQNLFYDLIDNYPLLGTSYYRLKMVDEDGTFSYSEVETIERSSIASIRLYPNPTNGQLTIEGPTVELEQIGLTNLLGQDLNPLIKITGRSATKIVLDLSHLPNGTYLLRTNNTAEIFYKR